MINKEEMRVETMFSYLDRQYIFRESDGEIRRFFRDERQNLCCCTLTGKGAWSASAVILHKNVCRGFYAEIDKNDAYHLLFQDGGGSVHYSRIGGQSVKTAAVLKSKTPSACDRQLFIAPLDNGIYLFYVLQRDNAFMLVYQVIDSDGISPPKMVDYVSGSNIPCSIAYDAEDNIYAFYQSYDGKYLQLGFKKFGAPSRHWSDFVPVTKYAGNCEYPHAIVDGGGTIHLCYQRRSPKFYEMVYQQKTPGRNLWSPEAIVHSSVHSFDNASILQAKDSIVIYWVRDDVIYYSAGSYRGNTWSKPARYGEQFGRELQCLCYKSNSPADRIDFGKFLDSAGGAGSRDAAYAGRTDFMEAFRPGDKSGSSIQLGDKIMRGAPRLAPAIYPGSTANGLRLAFADISITEENGPYSGYGFQQGSGVGENGGSFRQDAGVGHNLPDVLGRMHGSIAEIREGLSSVKTEIARLANLYAELAKEIGKLGIRMDLVEKQAERAKTSASRTMPAAHMLRTDAAGPATAGNATDGLVGDASGRLGINRTMPAAHMLRTDAAGSATAGNATGDMSGSGMAGGGTSGGFTAKGGLAGSCAPSGQTASASLPADDIVEGRATVSAGASYAGAARQPPSSADPEKLREWEEWQGPEEWQDGGES